MTDRGKRIELLEPLARLLSPQELLTDAAARRVYASDSSHLNLGRPIAVALPDQAHTVSEIVRFCAKYGIAVVTRGSGTGLSGGAVPGDGQLVLSTARLQGVGPVDPVGRRVRVETGVLNDQVSAHAATLGLHFAPDPSSQSTATIGGNIAENAGGPHCLRHGVTLQHLLNLEWVDARGRRLVTSRGLAGERGIDLTSLLCGSEGTLGVVTAADLKLVDNPATVATMAAFFPDLNDATRSVVDLLGAGLLPVAVEMVDRAMLVAVEAAFGFGFPTDVDAAMILEFAGNDPATSEDADRAETLLRNGGARDVRRARDEAERLELWKCRKKAFGAVGRLAPSYVTMDVVVPLGRLPELVREIQVIRAQYGVDIATAFHAGDGNLHPGVHYDDRDAESTRNAHAAADAIMRAALEHGGSVTGEHGIGIEKLHAASWQLEPVALDLMWRIKHAFDPKGLLNPGKALPAEDSSVAAPKPVPDGCSFDWASLTVTAAAEVNLADLQAQALERGLWLPIGLATATPDRCGLGQNRTVGSLLSHALLTPPLMASGSVRDYLLELWAQTGDDRVLHVGAPVVKNVAGYQLAQMLCGSADVLAVPLAATFQLKPAPGRIALWQFEAPGPITPASPAFEPLFRILAERDPAEGSALLVVEAGDTFGASLLVAGRADGRDLAELEQEFERGGPAGINRSVMREVPFQRHAELLSALPAWALDSPNWSVAAPPAADSGTSAVLPRITPPRWILQGASGLCWSPDSIAEQIGWRIDTCCIGNCSDELPRPGPGVPIDLLRSLKTVFDPQGNLPTPEWLQDANDRGGSDG